ncbi:MAG TPA: alpha/beta hydrolase [Acidobacteriota bacterium]|nr:alpha/beta hydrolase [Acidobacteriota bacterium]
MKKEIKFLTVPGWTNSGPQHWQSLWEQEHPEYVRVEQKDWIRPVIADWVEGLRSAIEKAGCPVVLIGHSTGCIAIVHYAHQHKQDVRGAFLVAPSDVERDDFPPSLVGFAPIPMKSLPFASLVVASSTDPYTTLQRARQFADGWGSKIVEVGALGHINTASGHGPWPEGQKLLAEFTENVSSWKRFIPGGL